VKLFEKSENGCRRFKKKQGEGGGLVVFGGNIGLGYEGLQSRGKNSWTLDKDREKKRGRKIMGLFNVGREGDDRGALPKSNLEITWKETTIGSSSGWLVKPELDGREMKRSHNRNA